MENQNYNQDPYSGYQTTPPPFQAQAQSYAQQPFQNEQPPIKPKNWRTEAILVTVIPFCCLCSVLSLLGIIGIVYAGKVDSLYFAGRYGEAEQAAKDAKMWVLISLGIAVFALITQAILTIVLLNNADFMDAFMQGFESALNGSATEW